MGKMRSLTSDEILAQFFFATKMSRLHQLPDIRNIVFMGMGEPADNAEHVIHALNILTTRELFQISAMKVTGTCVFWRARIQLTCVCYDPTSPHFSFCNTTPV